MFGLGEFSEILAALLVAAILFLWRMRRVKPSLDQIPEPRGLPIFGVLFEALLCKQEDMHQKVGEWAQKYGPILKFKALGVERILLSGPDEIEVVLNSKENITKDAALSFLHPWLGTGLLTSTGNKWRSRRKMLNPSFHYKIMEDFVPVFNANSAILVAKLREHTDDEYVEINDYAALCALDILCETVLGTKVHAQEGREAEYVTSVKQIFEVFNQRAYLPWLHFDFIYRLTSLWRKQQKLLAILHRFSEKIIHKRRSVYRTQKSLRGRNAANDDSTKLHFLDVLIEISEKEGTLTNEDIREEVDTIMVAGHDTTAAAISWTLFLLGSHQTIQDKVMSELSDIFGSDRRQPTIADLQNMTYLDMVIKEALRLYPSSPYVSRELQTELKIGGYTVPMGSNLILALNLAQRNPDIYPDPDRFDPERFSPDQAAGRHPCAYIPFSAGPRNCIGQKFARLELKCVLSSVIRSLKIESLDKQEDVKIMIGVVLRPKDNLKLRVSARD